MTIAGPEPEPEPPETECKAPLVHCTSKVDQVLYNIFGVQLEWILWETKHGSTRLLNKTDCSCIETQHVIVGEVNYSN